MLHIIRNINQLNMGQFLAVYGQSIFENGMRDYSHLPGYEQLLRSEQDFYAFMQYFLRDEQAFCAIWLENGCYTAALRMEPYKDGLLLEGLETAPKDRGKGYATALMKATVSYLSDSGPVNIYAHIDNINTASLKVHKACGFEKHLDYAVYVDGSVSHKAETFLLRIN